MKTIAFVFALCISAAAWAGNDAAACSTSLTSEIVQVIAHEAPFSDFDLEGVAVVTFTIDDDQHFQISSVESSNLFLKNHIMDALNHQPVQICGWESGKTYTVRLKYVRAA